MSKKINKVLIATGGTGGHVFPAYGLAKHLVEKKINVEIVSDKRGFKFLKESKDIKVSLINTSSIYNKNFVKKIFSLLIIAISIIKSFIYLICNRPNLVFGMGGYSSFPICIVAKLLKIPFIIYENNLHIGKANKFLLPFAIKLFVANKELTGIQKNYEKKICQTGNIIREEILRFNKNLDNLENDKKIKILILGGSQAAKIFAEKLPKILEKCCKDGVPLKVFQQCLPEQNHYLLDLYNKINLDCEIFNFSDDIVDYFSKVNLAITRAGSSMLAELINVNIPFISVPLPSSADNHQLKNAIYYEKNQYSYLIEEKNLDEKLFKLIKEIHKNRSLLTQMMAKQKLHSDKKVYKIIDEEIGKIIK
ncbi:UDP-N-acetylglucosamine--N-acetylmuramyl-(pentapeptide) pyrophosphoryl-undecaprenol N-acetylglucosamine transferase [Candidatus Pelagibacter bacterium]|nr:UDP-N-acetylglucosamine--N-acetylmuramyl-(pentapeptide) pyrophosphoryl-undecaprenol N-acetylglucosamine transferase [Candidatus Pelagibacter bacterium]